MTRDFASSNLTQRKLVKINESVPTKSHYQFTLPRSRVPLNLGIEIRAKARLNVVSANPAERIREVIGRGVPRQSQQIFTVHGGGVLREKWYRFGQINENAKGVSTAERLFVPSPKPKHFFRLPDSRRMTS